jgi:hypothetical protein
MYLGAPCAFNKTLFTYQKKKKLLLQLPNEIQNLIPQTNWQNKNKSRKLKIKYEVFFWIGK